MAKTHCALASAIIGISHIAKQVRPRREKNLTFLLYVVKANSNDLQAESGWAGPSAGGVVAFEVCISVGGGIAGGNVGGANVAGMGG